MKKIILVMALSLISSSALAQTTISSCSVVPSCEELGYVYTEAECQEKDKVKCPFDNTKLWCDDITYKTCEFGDYIYADKKCYKKSPPGNPVGVVIDPINRFAIYKTFKGASPFFDSSSSYNTAKNNGELEYDNSIPIAQTKFVSMNGDGSSNAFDTSGYLEEEAQSYINLTYTGTQPASFAKCAELGEGWVPPTLGVFYYYAKRATQDELNYFTTNANKIGLSLTQKYGIGYRVYIGLMNLTFDLDPNAVDNASSTKQLRILLNTTAGNAATVSLTPKFVKDSTGSGMRDYTTVSTGDLVLNGVSFNRCVMIY